MNFQRNCWYVAADSGEVGRQPITRTIAEFRILMFRREDGVVTAMSGICPHRFAPLERGTLNGDTLTCKYHGLVFGADGRCIHNPHGGRASPRMHLASYPVVERYGFVWVWPGKAEASRSASIPDLSRFENSPGRRTVHSYLYTNYRYDILVDNLLDLSHADYLHKGSFSSGAAERTDLVVRESGDEVIVERTGYGAPAPPNIMARPQAAPITNGLMDFRMTIHWHPGQIITFRSQSAPTGMSLEVNEPYQFFHVATPADCNHTHYFMGITRIGPDDAKADQAVQLAQRTVIETEDGPMLDAVHEVMAGRELLDLKPLILPVDEGGLRVRRVMQRLMERETTATQA